eukprot:799859-Prymnesium_polylepis.1
MRSRGCHAQRVPRSCGTCVPRSCTVHTAWPQTASSTNSDSTLRELRLHLSKHLCARIATPRTTSRLPTAR